jgi:hypothetical protein
MRGDHASVRHPVQANKVVGPVPSLSGNLASLTQA